MCAFFFEEPRKVSYWEVLKKTLFALSSPFLVYSVYSRYHVAAYILRTQ